MQHLQKTGGTSFKPNAFLRPRPAPVPIPPSHSPYTLPSSVSRKSFACLSYENTRGVGVFFPFRNNSFPSVLQYLRGRSFLNGRGNNFSNALAQGRHIFLGESLRLDGVMQVDRNLRRPQHPVARPMVLKRSNHAHR